MSLITSDVNPTPSQVLNNKPLIATINIFYKTNQLSTIVDQTNPLSELDNLRRITVGGPGGIEKQRASFSIRDISSSQYGRIDPIRSPEGPNIGVVTYMAMYGRVNDFGFLEAPYKQIIKEKNGSKMIITISNKVDYLQADDEEKFYFFNSVSFYFSYFLFAEKRTGAGDKRLQFRFFHRVSPGQSSPRTGGFGQSCELSV